MNNPSLSRFLNSASAVMPVILKKLGHFWTLSGKYTTPKNLVEKLCQIMLIFHTSTRPHKTRYLQNERSKYTVKNSGRKRLERLVKILE